jgi:hypothetical protein
MTGAGTTPTNAVRKAVLNWLLDALASGLTTRPTGAPPS